MGHRDSKDWASKTIGAGPGEYNPQLLKSQSNVKIAIRFSEKADKVPGPGTYPIHHLASKKPSSKMGTERRSGSFLKVNGMDSPGPGTYSLRSSLRKSGVGFGSSIRKAAK